ncbi:hypothetical protein Hanom_Chr05g00466561 [Helianthus anomalus]
MHEAREGGGGHDFEVRFPMQTNQEPSREVGPVEFNGFKCGSGKVRGRPSRRPGVEVRARKAQSRSRGNVVGSPSDNRPKKKAQELPRGNRTRIRTRIWLRGIYGKFKWRVGFKF